MGVLLMVACRKKEKNRQLSYMVIREDQRHALWHVNASGIQGSLRQRDSCKVVCRHRHELICCSYTLGKESYLQLFLLEPDRDSHRSRAAQPLHVDSAGCSSAFVVPCRQATAMQSRFCQFLWRLFKFIRLVRVYTIAHRHKRKYAEKVWPMHVGAHAFQLLFNLSPNFDPAMQQHSRTVFTHMCI